MWPNSFKKEVCKIATDNRPDPGYWAKNVAVQRAIRRGDKGVAKLIASSELMKQRAKNVLAGAIGGAGIGAGTGAGVALATKRLVGPMAVIGGVIGGLGGANVGHFSADKRFLKSKGIEFNPILGVVHNMTPEAKAKYLSKKYKGVGYSK